MRVKVAEFTAFGGLRRNPRPGVGERFVQQYVQAVCSGGRSERERILLAVNRFR